MAPSGQNKLLALLSDADWLLLQPHLSVVDLHYREKLQSRFAEIEHIYFPEAGLASVISRGKSDCQADVALIGRDGMTGIGLMLGVQQSVYDVTVQMAGRGQRCSASSFLDALDESATLRVSLLRYVHNSLAQCSETALANVVGSVEQRLSRWLLMADDRVGGPLALTHELLGLMLSVRRAGVTEALHGLKERGLVSTQRRKILIEDREGLIAHTNGLYGTPRGEFEPGPSTAKGLSAQHRFSSALQSRT